MLSVLVSVVRFITKHQNIRYKLTPVVTDFWITIRRNKLPTSKMDWPMLYTGNQVLIKPGMVFFMHMILMDSDNELAMKLGETYLVTENGNERLGKKTLDLVVG